MKGQTFSGATFDQIIPPGGAALIDKWRSPPASISGDLFHEIEFLYRES